MSTDLLAEAGLATHAMKVSYLGTAFFGWQRHGGKPTIQGALEDAIAEAFDMRSAVQGSGRTDRGAHATGQVASVSLPEGLDCPVGRERLNAVLPEEIRVLELALAPPGFHALESCIGKQYRYEMWVAEDCPPEKQGLVWYASRPLDREAMVEAATHLIGRKDFASFATKTNFKPKSTVRDLSELRIEGDGPGLTLLMRADGFLYKMVRNIVCGLVRVGKGQLTPGDFLGILMAKDRKAATGAAPATGLYLDVVYYPVELFGG